MQDSFDENERQHTQFLDLTNGDASDDHYHDDIDEEDDGENMMEDSPGSGVHAGERTSKGRVVEPGREHTGRWTKEEHESFLEGLKMYGKEWKKVAAKVKTRTVVQTRTHAQKYFQKLQKVVEATGDEGLEYVDMGVSSETKNPPSHKKRKIPPPPPPKINRRSSNTTLSAAQVISNLGAQPTYVTTATTPPPTRPKHGFSTESHNFGWINSAGMKIVAPEPSYANKFPEPSPAATGKRKLAEIAAARMLAGVAGVASQSSVDDRAPTPPLMDRPGGINIHKAPRPPPLFGDSSSFKKPLSLQIVNPDTLGVSLERKNGRGGDSPVTPWETDLEALVGSKVTEDDRKTEAKEYHQNITSRKLPIFASGDLYGRSTLHMAICDGDMDVFEHELNELVAPEALNRLDEAGFAPIHSACASRLSSFEMSKVAADIVRRLIAAGANPNIEDSKGNTPLHWAARAGDREIAELLLYKNVPLDAENKSGETPLHWGLRAGRKAIEVVNLLLENGARDSVMDNNFHRPIDVASDGFVDEEGSVASLKVKESQDAKISKELKRAYKLSAEDRRDARANFLIRSTHSRTLVLHHPECLEHHPKSESDWEAPDRVVSIMRRVVPSSDPTGTTETSGIFPHEVTVSKEFERAKLDFLRRVHSTEYLSFVHSLSKDLEKQLKKSGERMDDSDHGFQSSPPPVVPFTPMVQRTMIKVAESRIKQGIYSDTAFSSGSLRAARRASGAVQHAVDCVLVGRNRNAFCVVRPPGHHAGVNGLLDGGESCGFCIFNNVAAGALYAISDDRELCSKVAIVDIDVHHGNGTEEIVRKCHDPSKLFFFSIHLYDNDKKKRTPNQSVYKFYPGTGSEDDLALNIINVPIIPLWKSEQAGPAQTSARTHNTRQKTRSSQDDFASEVGTNTRDGSLNSDVGSESGSISSPRPSSGTIIGSGRMAYRQAIQNRLLPALRAFNPDLILISTGFDALKGDVGNARHERGGREKIGLDLEPEDYAWVTRKILEIADICCHGRVVSVLEGGYGRTPPAPQPEGKAVALDRTIFAEGAIRHLHALIDPYNSEQRFSSF